MTPDMEALATRLDAEPRDPVTLQALADLLEERGADPASIRALTVDGPTVLVFGYPPDSTMGDPEILEQEMNKFRELTDWLTQLSGHPVRPALLPSDWTIRMVKASPPKEPTP